MSNAVAINDDSVRNYLSAYQKSLGNYFDGNSMDGFMRSAMLMISESDQLKDCIKTEAGKKSLYHAMKYAAGTGLSLNPQEGKAAIMAFGGKVQYQVMKNGLIELAMQSGKVQHISSDTVRENDRFDVVKTVNGDSYEFSPARKNRGEIDGFYAAVKMLDGSCHIKYMTKEEAEAHRDKYSAMYKSKPAMSPWSKSFEGMGLKTVIKALFRNLSISPDLDKAIGTDDKSQSQTEPRNVTPETEADAINAELTAEPEPKPEKPKAATKAVDKKELF